MSKFFFTADLHFFHKKILNFTSSTRPVATLEEMHTTLIENWNSQVSPFDHVYVLGDLSFGNSTDTISVLAQLNGTIHIIKGNHDHWINNESKKYIASVEDYKVFKQGEHRAVLFHYPIAEFDRMQHGSFHFYGHVHGSLTLPGRAIDVGIDARPNPDMKLWEWDELVEEMLQRPILKHHNKN